ncbi:hypothetical protein DV096_04065 [Bradymonadaceae bacterium TMQ3]|nr:hypothetical protein DV096_04065 [Bradymonadaceae bacterium TMQ3]TXC77507.1 hypothetical protein FRC91_01870 [Bradymonadales bacterium TMQ1]
MDAPCARSVRHHVGAAMKVKCAWIGVALAAGLMVGCGEGSEAEEPLVIQEDVGDGDVEQIGEVDDRDALAELPCGEEMLADWPLLEEVSSGAVEVSEQGGVFSATIDASAGGTQGGASNPFVYLNLATGEKAQLNDVEAALSEEWHLGFKRVVIRSNSGDSGPGGVLVTKMSNTSFEDVNSVPGNPEAYRTDDTYDASCTPELDPIGTPMTAFNYLNLNNPSGSQSWYSYGGGVSPVAGDVYVLRVPSTGEAYKMEITGWTGGEFELRWAEIN